MAKAIDTKPEMTWKKLFFCLLLLVAMATAIAILGPMSSRYADKVDKRKIDKNGKEVSGVIIGKWQSRGRQLYFVYSYQGKEYHNYEEYSNYKNRDYQYYDSFKSGDAVSLQIDTLSPGDSYIIRK